MNTMNTVKQHTVGTRPMTMTSVFAGAAAAAALTVGSVAAPHATADDHPAVRGFGAQQELVDADGSITQGWTITHLRPSTDVIGWPARGHLWEASADLAALRGCPLPIIPNFNARAGDGETYQVLATADAPNGIRPDAICAPEHSRGKLYFDVVGQEPDGVVYRDGNRDVLIWTNTA